MSGFKKVLPYLIISLVSVTIIVAAIFVVPMMFNGGEDDGAAAPGGKFDDVGDSDFINSIGGVSETYVGAVSNYSYSSVLDAAYAYIENEVAGNAYTSSVTCETVDEFAPSEVDITIPSELLANADSVSKVNVTYLIENASTYSTMSTAESTGSTQSTTVVYIIKYGPDFKYFVPMPVTGETISKSYYDSVFGSDRYENCTLSTSMSSDISVDMDYEGYSINVTVNIKLDQTIKYDNGKIWLYQYSNTTTVYSYNNESESDTQEQTIYAYITEGDYGYPVCYIKYNEGDAWRQGSLYSIGFSSVEELTPFYDQYLDYTYFSKTSYGFALEDENAKQYFLQAFEQISDSMMGVDFGKDGIDMTARYYVQEGVLSGVQTDAVIKATVSEAGESANLTVTVNSTTSCKDYGTTVVQENVGHNH